MLNEFKNIKTWEERYQKIIALGKNLPPLPESEKTADNLVRGCQSQVWLVASLDENGVMQLRADSDALIVKGLIALLLEVYNHKTPSAVLETSIEFVKDLGLDSHLSPSRANGFFAMIKQIRFYAIAFGNRSTSKV